MISNAIPEDAIARVIGTKLEFIDLRNIPQRMPVQVALLAPVSAAAEAGLAENIGIDFQTAREIGEAVGYKSPAYRAARMLRPETGGGLSTIRTTLFPVKAGDGVAAAGVLAINIAAVNPDKNITHYIKANGRRIPFVVLKTDDVTSLANRIKDTLDAAIKFNTVDSVVQAAVGNDIDINLTAGWKGESGNEIDISIEADDFAGIIYTNPVFAGGVGTYDVSAALANFGETWYNVVVNAVDVAETVLDQLEDFNGSAELDTGRWNALVTKPFVSFYGTNENDKDDIVLVPDTRKADMTNSKVPAPGSPGFTFEIAAAFVLQIALTVTQNPPKSYSGKGLLDVPAPANQADAGDFNDYLSRDFIESKGVSSATLNNGVYYIEDVNMHYHPDGENPAASPYFRVVNVLGRSMNVIYQYRVLEESALMDKILVEDVTQTSNPEAIDPKKWASIVREFITDLQTEGITTRADESRDTVLTGIGAQNPERVETSFSLIYSGNVRQADSTVRWGFNFGG